MGKLLTIVLFSFLFPSLLFAEIPIPPATEPVIDLTGVLSKAERTKLADKIYSFEDEKGAQIAVLIVPTTQPESIEQYALRVAESWKLGRKGVDDGILLLVALRDRQVRIEVGYGLEGVISDIVVHRIIEEQILPSFSEGLIFEGISRGVLFLMKGVKNEPLLPPPPVKERMKNSHEFENVLGSLLIPGYLLGSILDLLIGRLWAACLVGGSAVVIGSFLGGIATGGVVGGILFIVTLLFTGYLPFEIFGRGTGSRTSSRSWGGGGGRFGGGGASGRW